jgi:hypothetical protein
MSTITAIPDPHVALHRQLGERIVDARRETERLTGILTHIDELRQKLRESGVEVQVDLGDVGNAAADMRRQLEAGAVKQTFALPGKERAA